MDSSSDQRLPTEAEKVQLERIVATYWRKHHKNMSSVEKLALIVECENQLPEALRIDFHRLLGKSATERRR